MFNFGIEVSAVILLIQFCNSHTTELGILNINILDNFFNDVNIQWKNSIGICIDGAQEDLRGYKYL